MTARDVEAVLIARCAAVAREDSPPVQNQREANVLRLAAMVVRSQFPRESNNLMMASEHYFAMHPNESLPASTVIRNGWVSDLPRLRDMLSRQLS